MATTTRAFLFLVLLAVSQVALSVRFKIAISQDDGEAFHQRLTKRSTPCGDKKLIKSDGLNYPKGFENVGKKPWVDNKRATVYTSAKATEGINLLYSFKVPGLGTTTIADVLQYLQDQGCLSFPYGGCVRDQFLQKVPADLDMETNCDADSFYEKCVKKWGKKNCPRNPINSPIVHVGDPAIKIRETDIIDASNWEKTFFGSGKDLEYTTNSLTYFAGDLNIVIDLTGTGVDDTCNHKINIPVSADDWDSWVSYTKVFRFWKLRVKEYTADDATMKYIKKKAKDMMLYKAELFKKLYCLYALNGEWVNDGKVGKCTIDPAYCGNNKKEAFDTAFTQDLGDDWTYLGKILVKNLECSACSQLIRCKLVS